MTAHELHIFVFFASLVGAAVTTATMLVRAKYGASLGWGPLVLVLWIAWALLHLWWA